MRVPSAALNTPPSIATPKDEKGTLSTAAGKESAKETPFDDGASSIASNNPSNPRESSSQQFAEDAAKPDDAHVKTAEVPLDFMFSQSFPPKFSSVSYPTSSNFPIQEISPPWSGASAYNGSSQMINPAQGHEIDTHSQGETKIKELKKELEKAHDLRKPYRVGSIQPPTSELDSMHYVESWRDRVWRKTKENPLVPIGALATVAALTMGLRAFSSGDAQKSQRMMRYRVLAQGFTLVAFGSGLLYWQHKKNQEKST